MELQLKFDPYSAADRDRVRKVLDTLGAFPTARAPALSAAAADAAVLEILAAHGGEARHNVLSKGMKAKGFRGWLNSRYRLIKAKKIVQVGRGLYRVV